MKLQKLLSLTRQAIDAYGMIEENDKIAVGISGGKDSLTLLYALSHLRKFYPDKFDIVAVCWTIWTHRKAMCVSGSWWMSA